MSRSYGVFYFSSNGYRVSGIPLVLQLSQKDARSLLYSGWVKSIPTTRYQCEFFHARGYQLIPIPVNCYHTPKSLLRYVIPYKTYLIYTQRRIFREDDQIVGSYLEIKDVRADDYGEYKCEVSNSVDQLVPMSAYISRQGNWHSGISKLAHSRLAKPLLSAL